MLDAWLNLPAMMRTWSGLIEIREVWYRSLRLGKRKRKTINKIPKLRRFSKSCTYYNPHSSSQSALFLWCVSIINMLCSNTVSFLTDVFQPFTERNETSVHHLTLQYLKLGVISGVDRVINRRTSPYMTDDLAPSKCNS